MGLVGVEPTVLSRRVLSAVNFPIFLQTHEWLLTICFWLAAFYVKKCKKVIASAMGAVTGGSGDVEKRNALHTSWI